MTPLPPMSYAHAIILGIIQGATEFLPVSSTAHMRIIPALLGWGDPGTAYSAIVQLGPIVAIIAFFASDLLRYLAGIQRSISAGQLFPKGDTDARFGWYTVFGTIPLAIFGLLLEKKVDHEYRNLYFIAAALILLALVLFAAEKVGKRNRNLESLSFKEAMIVGFAQVLALVPGASRSGTTITAGLFLGLDRESAARFSFLLSIPAIALAGLYKLYKVVIKAHAPIGSVAGPYILSAVVAGIVAYVVVRWLLGYLSKESHSTTPFIIYRIALGVALIFLAQIGFVAP